MPSSGLRYLSSAVLDTGAEGAPDFPENAATCFFTAAKPLLFCRDPISVCEILRARGGGGQERSRQIKGRSVLEHPRGVSGLTNSAFQDGRAVETQPCWESRDMKDGRRFGDMMEG